MSKNTLHSGSVRVIIFKEKKVWYGAVLEFNIVESGTDPREVMLSLDEAIRGYVECARKARLSPKVLNQKPAPEYEKMWKRLQQGKPIPSPIQVYSFGEQKLTFAK